MKQIKVILIIGIIALAFAFGVTVGEKTVIKHQHIEKTSTGYIVEFDGELYDYSN